MGVGSVQAQLNNNHHDSDDMTMDRFHSIRTTERGDIGN
jgi:hypothetical protein